MTEIVARSAERTSAGASKEILASLPDEARLWIYGAERELSPEEVDTLLDTLGHFLTEWSSHGRDVHGAVEVIDRRFLLIGAHIPSGDISGCGIDKSTRIVTGLGEQLGFAWAPSLQVFFRDSTDSVCSASRGEFRTLARKGAVDRGTLVYDLTLDSVGELRGYGFVRSAAKSWHGPAFGLHDV